MTEGQIALAKDRASRAKDILESDIMGEVFTAIEKRTFEEMLQLPHDDDAGRKHCVDKVNAIRGLAQELKSIVGAGISASRIAPTLS